MVPRKAVKVQKHSAKRKQRSKAAPSQRLKDKESIAELDHIINEQQYHIRSQIDHQAKHGKRKSSKPEAWETLQSLNELASASAAGRKGSGGSRSSESSSRLMNNLLEGITGIDVSKNIGDSSRSEALLKNRSSRRGSHRNDESSQGDNEPEIEI